MDAPFVDAVLGSAAGKTSWQLDPQQQIQLHLELGLDAVYVPLPFWKPRALLGSQRDIRSIEAPSPQRIEGAFQRLTETVALAHAAGLAVCAYNHGCFDVVYEGLGFENFMLLLYDDFAYVEDVMEYLHRFHMDLSLRALDSGVDFFLIGDDIAYKGGLFIQPELFFRLWEGREAEHIALIKKAGFPVEFHTDGALEPVLEKLIALGVDSVNPAEPYANDIGGLKEKYGHRLCFRGNLDVGGCLASEDPAEAAQEAELLVRRMMGGGNYIFGSSHSLTSNVRPANYRAALEAVKRVGRYEAV